MFTIFQILILGTITTSLQSVIAPGTSCNSPSGCLPSSSYKSKSQQTAREGKQSPLEKANTWSPVVNPKATLNDQTNKSKKYSSTKFNNLASRNAGVTVYANDYLFDSSTVVEQNAVAKPWIRYRSYQPITVATSSKSDIQQSALSENRNAVYKTINGRNDMASFNKQNIDSNLKEKSPDVFYNKNGVKKKFLRIPLQGNIFQNVDHLEKIDSSESTTNLFNGYSNKKSFKNNSRGYHLNRINNVSNKEEYKNHPHNTDDNDKNTDKLLNQHDNKNNKLEYQNNDTKQIVFNKEKQNIDRNENDNKVVNLLNRNDQYNTNDNKFENQKHYQATVINSEQRSNNRILGKTTSIFDYLRKFFNVAERLFYIPQIESRKASHGSFKILSDTNTNDLNAKLSDFICKIMHCQRRNKVNINRFKESRTSRPANQVGVLVLRGSDNDKSADYLENNSNPSSIISSISFRERKRKESSTVSIPLEFSDKISTINDSSKSNQTALKESDESTPAGSLKSRTKSRENDLIPGDLAKKRKKSALQIYSQDPHDKRQGILKRKNAAILQLNFDIKVPNVRGENVYFRLKFPEESLRKSQDQSERNAGDVNYKKVAETLQNKISLTLLKENSNDTVAATESNKWLEINRLIDRYAYTALNDTHSIFKINDAPKFLRNIHLNFMPFLKTAFSGAFKYPSTNHAVLNFENRQGTPVPNKKTGNEQRLEHLLNRKRRSYVYYSPDKNFRPISRPNIHHDFKHKQERYYHNEQYGRHVPLNRFSKNVDTNHANHYSQPIGNTPSNIHQKIPFSYARQESYAPRQHSNTQSFSPRESRDFRGYMNAFNNYEGEASETQSQSQATRRGSLKSVIDKDITPLINSINNNVSNHTSNAQHIIHWYFIIPNQANGGSFFLWKNASEGTEAEDSLEPDLRSPILTAPAQLSKNRTMAENATMAKNVAMAKNVTTAKNVTMAKNVTTAKNVTMAKNVTTTTSTSSPTNASMENGKLVWNSTEYEYDDEIWHKNQWDYVTPPTLPNGTVITTKRPKMPSKWPWDIVHHHHHHRPSNHHHKYPRKTWPPWPEHVSCSCNKWYVPNRGWWPIKTTPMMPWMRGWDKK